MDKPPFDMTRNDLFDVTQDDRTPLTRKPKTSPPPVTWKEDREAFTLPLVKYIGRTSSTLFLNFLFDWSQIFRHPVGALTTLVAYPLASSIMIFVSVGFRTFTHIDPGFVRPKMLDYDDVKQELVDTAGDFLQDSFGLKYDNSLKITHYNNYKDTRYMRPSFNIDVAELMLILSALTYEREEPLNGEYPSDDTKLDRYTAYIRSQAEKWGLEFKSLSELGTNASPFCGAFYDPKKKFIVIAFKGTTPTDFAEWAIDATFMRTDGRSQLFGEVHEGFYRLLFGKEKRGRSKMIESYSYRNILKNLIDIVNAIDGVKGKEANINIWVTGHSLGSALATLFYSRLMRSPADLPDGCILRDAYVFGTPCIGNEDFAAHFASICNAPSNRFNTLWRVISDKDIVCRVPIGFDDPQILQYVSKNYIFDYAHIGEAIRLFQDGRRPKTDVEDLVLMKPEGPVEIDDFSDFEKKFGFLPAFIKDHIPYRYLNALQMARRYFPNGTRRREY